MSATWDQSHVLHELLGPLLLQARMNESGADLPALTSLSRARLRTLRDELSLCEQEHPQEREALLVTGRVLDFVKTDLDEMQHWVAQLGCGD